MGKLTEKKIMDSLRNYLNFNLSLDVYAKKTF